MYTIVPVGTYYMNGRAYPDDIPDEIFCDELHSWANVSKYRESGSIYVYHKGIVLRRHAALVKRPDLIKEIFHNQLPILIDLELSVFEDNDAIEAEFQKLEQASKTPTYWICGIDKLLIGKSDAVFHYLRKRQAENQSISYVLFFSVDFLHPSVRDILTYTSTFLQNTCISPLFSRDTGGYFLRFLSQKWKFNLSESLAKQLLDQTSRHFSLIKQAARYIRDTGSTNIHDILNHDMMKIKLKSIFDDMLPSEQSAMVKIVAGANDFTPNESASIDFLKKTQWVEVKNNCLLLTIPKLSGFIESFGDRSINIEITGNQITVKGVPVTSLFSHQESLVLKCLVRNKGKLVSRDILAQTIWDEMWNEKYSDWAIDQIICRIRNKCLNLGFLKTIIQSVKGKGFTYGVYRTEY